MAAFGIVSDLPIVEQAQALLDAGYHFVCPELQQSRIAILEDLTSEGKLYTHLYIQDEKILRTFYNEHAHTINLGDMARVKLPKKNNDKLTRSATESMEPMKPIKLYKQEDTITAMKKLVLEYLNGTHSFDGETCALCKLHKDKDNSPNKRSCKTCPWLLIAGRMCSPTPSSENLKRATELIEWIDIYQRHKEPEFEPFSIELKIDSLKEAAFWISTFGNSNDYKSPGSGDMYDEIKAKLSDFGLNYRDTYDYNQEPFGQCDEKYTYDSFLKRAKEAGRL